MNPNEPKRARRRPGKLATGSRDGYPGRDGGIRAQARPHDHGRWWLALAGIVSIVFGILLAIAPVIGAVVLTWWLGAYALAFGIALLVLAFRLRAHKGDISRSAPSPAT